MYYDTENVFTQQHDDTKIMVVYDKGFEVYYKRDGFPYMFAFGLPGVHTLVEVFAVAYANMNKYADLFD